MNTAAAPAPLTGTWVDICPLDQLIPGWPVGALLGARQIALVRVARDQLYAVSNFDPFGRAMVMARGIVGDDKGAPKLTSPIYKQGFDLRTGRCLDDPAVRIPTYEVRVVDARVQVLAP
jgi:nitrite reductase (NADH) small subunit